MQYGMNLNPRYHNFHGRPADINTLKGVKWARIVFSAAASRESIAQAMPFYEHQINTYNSIGMRTLLVLNQETFWGHGPWSNGDWHRYAREFADAIHPIVERLRGKGVAYQIWNEGDIEGHSSIYAPAAQFAHVLKAAHDKIKSIEPGALVVQGGLAAGAGDAVRYINEIRTALGGRLPVDAIGIHPYGQWTPNFDSRPDWGGWHGRLRDYMWHINRGMPRNIPLWLTEIGISENVDYTPNEYPMVVKYMQGLDHFFRSQYNARVPVLIWFAWSDVMRQAGIVDRVNQPKGEVYTTFFSLSQNSDTALPTRMGSGAPSQFGVLLAPTVNLSVRIGGSTSDKRIATMDTEDRAVALDHPTTVMLKVGKQDEWLHVKTPGGVAGYSAAWLLELDNVVLQTTAISGLNIRAGASVNHPKVGSVTPNDPMICMEPLDSVADKIGEPDQWLQVKLPDGTEGYAAGWLVKKLSDATAPDAPPVEEPPVEDPPIEDPDDDIPVEEAERQFVTPTTGLNLRTSPEVTLTNRITTMQSGVCLLVISDPDNALETLSDDGWIEVRMPNGTEGWTSAKFLERLDEVDCVELDSFTDPSDREPEPTIAVFVETTTHLNMRSAPEVTPFNRLLTLENGQCLLVVDDPQKTLETLGESGWIKIREAETQKEGWVSGEYLRRINAPDCVDLDRFDLGDDDVDDDDDKEGTLDPNPDGEFLADGFDAPVGSEEDRASADVWPGEWFDPTGFAEDTYPAYVKARNAYHTGVDLNLNKPRWNSDRGAAVYSIASGVVTYAQSRKPSWGNIIVIRHDPMQPGGDYVYSRYAHLATMTVKKGDRVQRGEKIGTIGAHLGRNNKPVVGAEHLHFDISPSDKLLDAPGDWPRKNLARLKHDYVDPKEFIARNRPKR